MNPWVALVIAVAMILGSWVIAWWRWPICKVCGRKHFLDRGGPGG